MHDLDSRAARLTGFVRLFDDTPAFVLPLFTSSTEKLLMQDVDSDELVIDFLPIELLDLSLIPLNNDIIRKVGDPALIAFERHDGDVIIGERSQLRRTLRVIIGDGRLKDRPFMRSGLAEFCGDRAAASAAERQALSRLHETSRTQQYYRQNVLVRDRIRQAFLENSSVLPPSFRLFQRDGVLEVRLAPSDDTFGLVKMQTALAKCESDLADIMGSHDFHWDCRLDWSGTQTHSAAEFEGKIKSTDVNEHRRSLMPGEALFADVERNRWHAKFIASLSDENRDELLRQAFQWLSSQNAHKGWPNVWRTMFSLDVKRRGPLREMALHWLENSPGSEYWPQTWILLSDENTTDRLMSLAYQWLDQLHNTNGWYGVWAKVFDRTSIAKQQHLLDAGILWMRTNPHNSSWSHVWHGLFRHSRQVGPELAAVARDRLRDLKLNDWPEVWSKLIRLDKEKRSDLFALGREWLLLNENASSWSVVWRILLEAEGQELPSLLQLGWNLLDDFPENPGWSTVWQAMLTMGKQDRERALLAGRVWLAQNLESDRWGHVWRRLLATDSGDRASLIQRGWSWLETRNDKNTWPLVWEALFQNEPDMRDRLLSIARTWVRERPSRALRWGNVWTKLVAIDHTIEQDLVSQARGLLYKQKERSGWPQIWATLFEHDPKRRSEYLLLGHQWLADYMGESGWYTIWEKLFDLGELKGSTLTQAAFSWALNNRTNNAWGYVWLRLVEVDEIPRDQLLAIGLEWLKLRIRRAAWVKIWGKIFDLGYHREAIIELGKQWLVQNERVDNAGDVRERLLAVGVLAHGATTI